MTTSTRDPEGARRRVGLGTGFDVVVVVGLSVVAYAVRRRGLPTDGLWFDDSWVAAGAALGSPSNLMSTGSGHPGFTAVLMAIHAIDPDIRPLALPALVAGVVAPAAIYGLLRMSRHGRAPSALLAAPLAVAVIPALYAGRVKGYTADLLLVTGLAAAVPLAAARRWGWRTAAVWVAAAVVVSTFSGYLLLATAAATFVLVLHPDGDRRVRLAALGVQAVIQGTYLQVARSRTDLAGIEEVMETSFDGHMEPHLNPLTMGRQVREHLFRIGEVYPGEPRELLTLAVVLALAGLVVGAVRGRTRTETLTARFLGLLVLAAAAGSLVDRFPFGPSNKNFFSYGGRHTMWMVPAIVYGLSVGLDRVRSRVGRTPLARRVLDVGLVALAVAALVTGYEPITYYPLDGTAPVTRMIEDELREGDLVLVTTFSTYSYAYSSRHADGVDLTPHLQVGFVPTYDTDAILTVGAWTEDHPDLMPVPPEQLIEGHDRVWIVGLGLLNPASLAPYQQVLEAQGWDLDDRGSAYEVVQLWSRE